MDLSSFVNGLKFTAGARYSWDYKSDNDFQTYYAHLARSVRRQHH